ncbi:uncharacterized protein LOC135219011 [Macrobrachium nipponense]|uniref:uncharacterized protein LOC135219011 n=1 Tax=Macrobrachium nipponense TaxID=159736 RepID=UPI0030C7ADE1
MAGPAKEKEQGYYDNLMKALTTDNPELGLQVPFQRPSGTIVAAYGDEELKVPLTPEAWKEERWNFPHVIGAVDEKHIGLRIPPLGGTHYFNYKKFYSMVLLTIADASYKFLYVDMGAIGSESDGGVPVFS